MRPSFPLFASHRWYEWYPTEPMAQHPTMWRFLAYGQFKGTANLGIPSATTFTTGYGVFDWDAGLGRYELTWFDPTPDYWGWAPRSFASFAWVSDTKVRLVGSAVEDSSITTARHAAKFSVAANGRFTWIEPLSTQCGNDLVNDANFYAGWAIGHNGGIIYPYADGKFYPSYPTSNCYIGKITNTNSATNLGPLRSGLTQGAQHAP
ncbi:MAG: hypothetical protein EOM03_16910, partial [Clostridia bacterium]|nr:hypothetical protein [Clostridia bacterium]